MHAKTLRLLRSLLRRAGYFSTPETPVQELTGLIRSLKPYETNAPLIRMGGDQDGGYLIPDDLSGIEHCFSPGVSRTAVFEEALLERGIKSFLVDASVDAPPATLRDCVFEKRFLASYEDEVHITLAHWLDRHVRGCTRDLLLQMDIEGAEYPVLLQTPAETLRRFRIVVIEFHDVEQLANRAVFDVRREAFEKLLRDFTVVHIHPNNVRGMNRVGSLYLPNVLEITFLRNDRVARKAPATLFPHALDRKNVVDRDDILLPACWYN